MIALIRDTLGLREALAGLDRQVRPPGATVQRAGCRFKIRRQRFDEVALRADLLLGVRDAEGLVQEGSNWTSHRHQSS